MAEPLSSGQTDKITWAGERTVASYPSFLPSKQGVALLGLEGELIDSRNILAARRLSRPPFTDSRGPVC